MKYKPGFHRDRNQRRLGNRYLPARRPGSLRPSKPPRKRHSPPRQMSPDQAQEPLVWNDAAEWIGSCCNRFHIRLPQWPLVIANARPSMSTRLTWLAAEPYPILSPDAKIQGLAHATLPAQKAHRPQGPSPTPRLPRRAPAPLHAPHVSRSLAQASPNSARPTPRPILPRPSQGSPRRTAANLLGRPHRDRCRLHHPQAALRGLPRPLGPGPALRA